MLPKPMQNPSDLKQNQYLTHQNHNETYEEPIRTSTKSVPNPSESQQNYAESTRISTKPMQNPSELQQDMQNPSESQQNLCRNRQNLNKTFAEPTRIPTKPMQNPSESQQNIRRIDQNLNNTYAEPTRISTIPMQDPSELQQKPTRIPTTPMQNPSELQQKFIKISAQSMQNPFISIKHTRPQPPEQQNPSHVLQPAPECRPYEPESPDSLGRSHMSYIKKRKRQRDIEIKITKATNTKWHNISRVAAFDPELPQSIWLWQSHLHRLHIHFRGNEADHP